MVRDLYEWGCLIRQGPVRTYFHINRGYVLYSRHEKKQRERKLIK